MAGMAPRLTIGGRIHSVWTPRPRHVFFTCRLGQAHLPTRGSSQLDGATCPVLICLSLHACGLGPSWANLVEGEEVGSTSIAWAASLPLCFPFSFSSSIFFGTPVTCRLEIVQSVANSTHHSVRPPCTTLYSTLSSDILDRSGPQLLHEFSPNPSLTKVDCQGS